MTIDHYKEALGRKWILVFYHKYENSGDLFVNNDEALNTNQANKYSILGKINKGFRNNGKYEFLLEYPKFPEEYNHWTQTKNPINAQPNTENGYKPIKVSWTGEDWHGLSLSSSTSSFIDGSPFSDFWFYAIGQKGNWADAIAAFKDIKGLNETDKNKYLVYEVKLWIRIDFGRSTCNIRYKSTPYVTLYVSLLIS